MILFMKKNKLSLLLFFCIAFLLSACAETQLVAQAVKQATPHREKTTKGYYKVGKPYRIRGKRYTPKVQWQYEEVGYASWYGLEDHNKMTANGEIFNQYELLAAHRTLQLPSVVEVTNLENGRRIKVRVCDRGPFKDPHKRIIDLSMRGAELLGFKKQGCAKVRIRLLPEETALAIAAIDKGYSQMLAQDLQLSPAERVDQNLHLKQDSIMLAKVIPADEHKMAALAHESLPVTPLMIDHPYYIQLGAFSDYGRAQEFGTGFSQHGSIQVHAVNIPTNGGGVDKVMYRVKLGPFTENTSAQNTLMEIQKNYQEAMIIQAKQ